MHHYVFDLLLLYQPLSSACVLSFSFRFLLHVSNIRRGCTFLFFNTTLSVAHVARLGNRVSLAGSAAVFSKLTVSVGHIQSCRSCSVADVMLHHPILLLNLTFYPNLLMNFSGFQHTTHLPVKREICEVFRCDRTLSNATLVLLYQQKMICNGAQALFQKTCLCLVCTDPGNLPLHILSVKLLRISLLRLGPILKASLFSFFFCF